MISANNSNNHTHINDYTMELEEEKDHVRVSSGRSQSTEARMSVLGDRTKDLRPPWTEISKNLESLAAEVKPDFMIVDWHLEPAVRLVTRQRIPIAVVWSEMPSIAAELPEARHESKDGDITSCPRFLGLTSDSSILLVLKRLGRWRGYMDTEIDPQQMATPSYISFVNTVFDLNQPPELSPWIIPVGPILEDTFPSLSQDIESFLKLHERVLFVTLGSHASFAAFETQPIMQGILSALEEQFIDGVIWATESLSRNDFFDVFLPLLNNEDPHWRFYRFAPQRAILAHSSTRLFLSQCGSSSLNETIYHGVPVLAVDKEHPTNSKQAEDAGIARVVHYRDVNSIEICKNIGVIVRDIYGFFQRAVSFMQKVAVANRSRKELAVRAIEDILIEQNRSSTGNIAIREAL